MYSKYSANDKPAVCTSKRGRIVHTSKRGRIVHSFLGQYCSAVTAVTAVPGSDASYMQGWGENGEEGLRGPVGV